MPSIGILIYNLPPHELLALAQYAERLGFEGLWFSEHYVIPQSHESLHPATTASQEDHDSEAVGETVRMHDPWFLMGFVASATSRIKLATGVCVVPLIDPLLLARATVTGHDNSEGRFSLGTGSGWLKEEFDVMGVPWAERGSRLDETLEVLKKALAGGFFHHDGRHFHYGALQVTPRPTPVPLICGGNSPPALRRAARIGDGWLNSAQVTLEQALVLRDTIEAERKAAGTADRPFRYVLRPYPPYADTVSAFIRAGFDDLAVYGVDFWSRDPRMPVEEKVAALEALARDLGLGAK